MNNVMSFLKKPLVLVALAVVATLAYRSRIPAAIRDAAGKLPGADA